MISQQQQCPGQGAGGGVVALKHEGVDLLGHVGGRTDEFHDHVRLIAACPSGAADETDGAVGLATAEQQGEGGSGSGGGAERCRVDWEAVQL